MKKLFSDEEINLSSYQLRTEQKQHTSVDLSNRSIILLARGEKENKSVSISEFEEHFHIAYYKTLRFASPLLEKKIRQRLTKAKQDGEIETKRRWLGAYYAPFLRHGYIAPIAVQFVDEHVGYGVFAMRELEKNDYIGEYTGLVMQHGLFANTINDYSFTYPLPSFLPSRITINSLYGGNEMRLLNHSDDPNCEAIGVLFDGILRIIIKSLRYIPKGEQLTYNYGDVYWRRRTKLPL